MRADLFERLGSLLYGANIRQDKCSKSPKSTSSFDKDLKQNISASEYLYIYVLMGNYDHNYFPCARLFLLHFLFYFEVTTPSVRFGMESECSIVSQLCAMVSCMRNSPVTP